jgi:hypothetical protein
MTTNNILLTIGAFVILTAILQNIYGIIGMAEDDLAGAQDMILANSIATSYLERANGVAFDNVTDTSDAAIGDPSVLTHPWDLGPDSPAETAISTFNDFDDFNGLQVEDRPKGSAKRFNTSFRVNYVNPANVDEISSTPTFVKRLDVATWRTFPPPMGVALDTLRMSHVMGYFHFD